MSGRSSRDRTVFHGSRGPRGIARSSTGAGSSTGARQHPPAARRLPYRRAMRLDQIAVQLYTVRALLATDLAGTLRAVAAAGYHSVELAGLPAADPGTVSRLLGEAGLAAVASHEGIGLLRRDRDAVADRLDEIGCPRVIVPWMPEDDRRTVDDVRRFASEVGQLAQYFAGRGIRLGYHNKVLLL